MSRTPRSLGIVVYKNYLHNAVYNDSIYKKDIIEIYDEVHYGKKTFFDR